MLQVHLKQWLIRRILGNLIILPAIAVNYAIITVGLVGYHLTSISGLSLVTVGDIIALAINNLAADHMAKWLLTFESFRVLIKDYRLKSVSEDS